MTMLKVIFNKESALLLRNKFLAIPFMMNVLFWGYIVVSYEIKHIHMQERAAAFYSVFLWVLLFNILVIGLFAVYMTSKDRESEFEALIVTYRVKNSEWLIGKWLATQLYGLAITFITLLIQTSWFLTGKMAVGEVVKNLFYVFMQMEGALFFVISLGFLCGIMKKTMFAYLLIPAILVLSLALPFDYSGDAYTFDNPRFHLLTPFDYMFIISPYEGIWGIDRVFGRSILHQIIVLLLGVVIILMTLLLFYSNRRVQWEKQAVPILFILLIIPTLLLSGIRYAQYDRALERFVTTGQQYVNSFNEDSDDEWGNSYYDAYLDYAKYDFSMERTDLTVHLQSNNQIKVSGDLLMKMNGDTPAKEVYLTLYHGLHITECTSDSEITCTQDQDKIIVQFDEMVELGETFELHLAYEGDILQYRDEGYLEHSFIQKNRVYLPKEAGWYPLIGERQLVVAREHNMRFFQFELRNGRLIEDFPTQFTVDLTNENGDIPLALTVPEVKEGLYQGTSQYGLSLIGGNVREMMVDQIRVVGHPEVLSAAKKAIENNQKTWSFIEEWLGIPMTPDVIYILNDPHSYLTFYTPSQEVLIWDTDSLKQKEGAIIHETVAYLITNNVPWDKSTDLHLLSQLVEWMVSSTFHDEGSFKKWYRPMETPMKEIGLIKTIDEYETQGELSDVIKFLYQQYAELEDKSEFNIKAALQLYEGEKGL